MISEFEQLADKVGQLAALAQSIRQQNAELRQQMLALRTENAELVQRMLQAQQRLTVLLEKIPVTAHTNDVRELA